jgi:hypothetical protein
MAIPVIYIPLPLWLQFGLPWDSWAYDHPGAYMVILAVATIGVFGALMQAKRC